MVIFSKKGSTPSVFEPFFVVFFVRHPLRKQSFLLPTLPVVA
jgi:hypothetical protein